MGACLCTTLGYGPTITPVDNIAHMTKTPPSRMTKDDLKAELDKLQAEREELAKANEELQAKVTAARDSEPVFMSARIPRSLRTQARNLGQQAGMSLQDVVREALEEWVAQQDTPPHQN